VLPLGRGSGKSHFFGGLVVEECLRQPGTLVVCIREKQMTLAQSSKRLIEDKRIERVIVERPPQSNDPDRSALGLPRCPFHTKVIDTRIRSLLATPTTNRVSPDIEEFLRVGQDRLRGLLPGNLGGRGIALIALAAIARTCPPCPSCVDVN